MSTHATSPSARRLRGAALALVLALPLALLPGSAAALAMLDFATASGQFGIESGVVDLGSDLVVTAAVDDGGAADPNTVGLEIDTDPVHLTGDFIDFGLATVFEIDTSLLYQLEVRDPGTGDVVLRADIDHGDFFTVFATGQVSPTVGPELANVAFDPDGAGLDPLDFPALIDLSEAAAVVDFNAVLSGAGQDFAARIKDGDPVTGSVAGSLVKIDPEPIPEPRAAALLALGLTGLTLLGRRRMPRA